MKNEQKISHFVCFGSLCVFFFRSLSKEPSVVTSPGLCCAVIVVACEVPKGTDRNAELKLVLQLGKAGEISELVSKIFWRSISKATRGLGVEPRGDQQSVGKIGPQPSCADCRKNWTTGLIPWNSGSGTHPPVLNVTEAVGRYKSARSAMREQGRSRTGIASLPHVKLAPMNAPDSTSKRQEHLDAIISFAGQRLRLFRALDIHDSVGSHQKKVDSSSTRSTCS